MPSGMPNWVLCTVACLASVAVIMGEEEKRTETTQQQSMGKPCESAYDCWRTEPVDIETGLPLRLTGPPAKSFRQKRLEVGGGRGRGGRCRCLLGACQLYSIPTSSFLPCEEF